jgi:methyl-accepting chemotaxis protein
MSEGWPFLYFILGGVAGAALTALVMRQRKAHDMMRIASVLERALRGDANARLEARALGSATPVANQVLAMLTQRLTETSQEAEALNASVISIMQAVGEMAATKDLSLRVPVSEDVTGAIADALNLLTDETSRVLQAVAAGSKEVAHATVAVKTQSDRANQAAGREHQEVILAASELGQAAIALELISGKARAGDGQASQTLLMHREFVDAVRATHASIAACTEELERSELRIKRLGERSLEIGEVVALLEQLAQRTGIVAMNASLQAMAMAQRAAHAEIAGSFKDSGEEVARRFARMAQEVRRLSEDAQAAAQSAARLVQAVRTEVQSGSRALQQLIGQVRDASASSQAAEGRMAQAHHTIEALAASVRDIARSSQEQAKVSAGLQERARIIQEASQETMLQLTLQAQSTRRLVDVARSLLDEIKVFRLPTAP